MTPSPRERIVEAALGLIAERGLGGVTMSRVAVAAGVARQTLYNHFADLDAIVVAVLEEHSGAGLDQLRDLLDATLGAEAKLDQLVRHRIATAHHGRDVEAWVSGLSAEARERIAEHAAGYRRIIGETVTCGVAEGVFRSDIAPWPMAVVIHGMLEAGGELAAEEPGSASQVAEMVTAMVATGLRGGEGG